MVDYWNITTRVIGGLIPNIEDSVKFNYIFLYILIAGFLSLTLCYVLHHRDEFWVKLDLFSKAAVSFLVGFFSYIIIELSYFFINIIRLGFTKDFNGDFSLNYFMFVLMILYSYLVIMYSRAFSKKQKGCDKFQILNYIRVSASFMCFLFALSSGTLSIIIVIFLMSAFKLYLLVILSFGIIFLYLAYSFLCGAINNLFDKHLAYDLHYFLKMITTKIRHRKKNLK